MSNKFKVLSLLMIASLLLTFSITSGFANETAPLSTPSCTEMGDCNRDGEVDYLDAMLVLQYHTGIVGDDALVLPCCDVDNSGDVDYLDAMLVLQYHTGAIDKLPATGRHMFVDGICIVCGQSNLQKELYLEDLNQLMQPLFAGNTVHNETVMFLDRGDVKPLLYPIDSIQSVTSYDGTVVYQEGKDYVIENGNIKVTENSAIPCITSDYFYNFPGGEFLARRPDGTLCRVYYGGGDAMAKWQVNVNYTHSATWDGFTQTSYAETYQKFLQKLQSGENVTILFYGDSITFGADASSATNFAPYQPPYTVLFTQALADLYDYTIHYVDTPFTNTCVVPASDYVAGTRGTITYVNTAVGGWTSADGVNNLGHYVMDYIQTYGCDLLVLAYGMNDGATIPKNTITNFKAMSDAVLHASPDASLLFVSTMVPNPNASILWSGTQFLQEKPLLTLAESYRNGGAPCSVACMTSVSQAVLEHKEFEDYSGNNINHPNDYFSRIYAQTLLQTLIGYENLIS